ncbi:MAG: phosphopantothenoylcysteine decarboxylase [Spirochaetales bacterium]
MNVVITSGGTSEKIDDVRKITNRSSGKLGSIIASTLLTDKDLQIENLFYICSKTALKPTGNKAHIIVVESANSVLEAVKTVLKDNKIDVFIHTMAVSDYTVQYVSTSGLLAEYIEKNVNREPIKYLIDNNQNKLAVNTKISSNEDDLIIKLKKTPKIISQIKLISPNTFLIGFKLLNDVPFEELKNRALELMAKNSCDLVVGNDLSNITKYRHLATIFDTMGNELFCKTKKQIAETLTLKIKNMRW